MVYIVEVKPGLFYAYRSVRLPRHKHPVKQYIGPASKVMVKAERRRRAEAVTRKKQRRICSPTEARDEIFRVGEPYLGTGRMRIQVNGVQMIYSHYVWFLNTGHWPDWNKQEVIHHIDGNILNDDFKNLELMTIAEHTSFHKNGENNPSWLGDNAHVLAKYNRHRKHPDKYPPLTDEEQEERKAYCRAYAREWRRKERAKLDYNGEDEL